MPSNLSGLLNRAARALTYLWNLATDEDFCLLADFVAEPEPGVAWPSLGQRQHAGARTRKMPVEELREWSHHTRRLRVGTQTLKIALAELPSPARLGAFEPELSIDSERVLWPELELGEFELSTYPSNS